MFWRLFFMKLGLWLIFILLLLLPLAIVADIALSNASRANDFISFSDPEFEQAGDDLYLNLTGWVYPEGIFGLGKLILDFDIQAANGTGTYLECGSAVHESWEFPAGRNTSIEIRQICSLPIGFNITDSFLEDEQDIRVDIKIEAASPLGLVKFQFELHVHEEFGPILSEFNVDFDNATYQADEDSISLRIPVLIATGELPIIGWVNGTAKVELVNGTFDEDAVPAERDVVANTTIEVCLGSAGIDLAAINKEPCLGSDVTQNVTLAFSKSFARYLVDNDANLTVVVRAEDMDLIGDFEQGFDYHWEAVLKDWEVHTDAAEASYVGGRVVVDVPVTLETSSVLSGEAVATVVISNSTDDNITSTIVTALLGERADTSIIIAFDADSTDALITHSQVFDITMDGRLGDGGFETTVETSYEWGAPLNGFTIGKPLLRVDGTGARFIDIPISFANDATSAIRGELTLRAGTFSTALGSTTTTLQVDPGFAYAQVISIPLGADLTPLPTGTPIQVEVEATNPDNGMTYSIVESFNLGGSP